MKRLFLFSLSFLIISALSFAQQPRLVMDASPSHENPVIINNPEISKVFYGELEGVPEYYMVSSEKPFALFIGILVPDIPSFREKRFSVTVKDSYNETLFIFGGENGEWHPFFDEFSRDYYIMGPEMKKYVPAGNYTLIVSSADKFGRYSLAVGDVDDFPVPEIINALIIIPKIKQSFFGMGAAESYMNASGLCAVLIALLLAVVLAFSLRYMRNNFVK